MLREEFEVRIAQEGYAAPVFVQREAGYSLAEHAHEFDAEALIMQGEFALGVAGVETVYRAGEVFKLSRGTVHTERCVGGAATYISARRA
jgi:quercetin dioxygenase-like cupin family protein